MVFIIEDCDIANYADGNTPMFKREKYRESFERFRKCAVKPILLLAEKELKGNANNCHLLITSGENVDIRKRGYYELI